MMANSAQTRVREEMTTSAVTTVTEPISQVITAVNASLFVALNGIYLLAHYIVLISLTYVTSSRTLAPEKDLSIYLHS